MNKQKTKQKTTLFVHILSIFGNSDFSPIRKNTPNKPTTKKTHQKIPAKKNPFWNGKIQSSDKEVLDDKDYLPNESWQSRLRHSSLGFMGLERSHMVDNYGNKC